MPTLAGNQINRVRRALVTMAGVAPLVASGIAVALEPSRAGRASMPVKLREAVSAYRRATMQGDIATLSDLVANDYILVSSDSSVQNKQSYINDFTLPGFKIDRYDVEEPMHMVWGHTALVRCLAHLRWTQDGNKQSRILRIAHVWVAQNGRWRIAYTQLTRVPDQRAIGR